MMWVFAIIIVAVIGAITVVASGQGGGLAPTFDDRPDVTVPADGPLRAEDLRAVRFTTVVRGYRASEVDALLDRLARQLADDAGPGSAPGPGDSGRLAE